MATRADYVTKPREHIASILRSERRFFSAAEIHERLEHAGAKVSLSTVYRTLDHLLQKAEVTTRVDPDGETTFMSCEPAHHHHHAICRVCGRVEDVDCTTIEQFTESLRALHGFELDEHAMEFSGRCRSCQ